MSQYDTATQIINSVAAQVGIAPVEDPYSSTNAVFRQLRYLLDVAGQELVILPSAQWPDLVREHEITTTGTETDGFPLPDDFSYMIDQTGWERSSELPLGGPLSAQDWTYLQGRNLITSTIYASFRLMQGKFFLFPSPPAAGLNITFEYASRNWVQEAATSPATYTNVTTVGADIVLFSPILIRAYLKAKYLESKGFDSTKARDDFYIFLESIGGKSTGAPIVNLSGRARYPYIDLYNTPDSGYGS